MLQHVLSRILQFAIVGAIGMALAGALEGAVTGKLFQICLQHPHFGSLRWVLGRGFDGVRQAAGIGGVVGWWLGFVAFAAIGSFHPTRQPALLLRHLLKFGILGTLAGVVLGAVSGAIFGIALMWILHAQGTSVETIFWPVSLPPVPLVVMLAESALFGYTWGVLLGFIGGLCCGLSIGVRRIRRDGEVVASVE